MDISWGKFDVGGHFNASKVGDNFVNINLKGTGIVGVATNGVPIYNSLGGDCCDTAIQVNVVKIYIRFKQIETKNRFI